LQTEMNTSAAGANRDLLSSRWRWKHWIGYAILYQCGLFAATFGLTAYVQWTIAPDAWKAGVLSRFLAWDAAHYVGLAEHGYQIAGDAAHHIVFYPAWPLLVAATSHLAEISSTWAAILLVQIISVVGHAALGPVLEARLPPDAARRVWGLFLLTPIAVYFVFPYTEALFLAATTIFFLLLYRRRLVAAALVAAVAAATRPPGVLLVVPFAVVVFQQRLPARCLLLLAIPIAPVALYLLLNWALFGDPLHYQDVLQQHWHKAAVNPWERYIQEARSLPSVTLAWLPGQLTRWLDVAVPLALPALVLLYIGASWSRRHVEPIAWEWIAWLIAMAVVVWSQSFWLSSARYLLIAFPLFVMLERVSRWAIALQRTLAACCGGLAAYGIWLFAGGQWIY
jgi:hypothetical protein